jgi:hypothetical protein
VTNGLARPVGLDQLLVAKAHWYDRVPANVDQARLIVTRVADEELLAVMLQSTQAHRSSLPSLDRTAHTLAYDAARKAVDAVLLAMGLRPSREGGHIATVTAAEAILRPPPASRSRNVRAFARARLVRHEDEYPRDPTTSVIPLRERRFQTQNCVRLVLDCQQLLGLDPTDDLIPTDDRLDSRQPRSS